MKRKKERKNSREKRSSGFFQAYAGARRWYALPPYVLHLYAHHQGEPRLLHMLDPVQSSPDSCRAMVSSHVPALHARRLLACVDSFYARFIAF